MRRPALLAGATFGLLFATSISEATVLLDWDLGELSRRADLVVVAKVISKQSFAAERTVMTRTKLQVERVLLGSETAEIEILQLGGILGDRIVDVPGDAELRAGETYLLFTAQPPGQPYRSLVGMSLGAHRLEGDQLTQSIDVSLMSRSGELRPAPGPRTRTLDEVVRAIREARR